MGPTMCAGRLLNGKPCATRLLGRDSYHYCPLHRGLLKECERCYNLFPDVAFQRSLERNNVVADKMVCDDCLFRDGGEETPDLTSWSPVHLDELVKDFQADGRVLCRYGCGTMKFYGEPALNCCNGMGQSVHYGHGYFDLQPEVQAEWMGLLDRLEV